MGVAQTESEKFLVRLESEAKRQSKLAEHPLLPNQLHGMATFVATHVWQVCCVAAVLTAVVLEATKLW